MFEIVFSGTCSIKSSYKYNRRIIFILCISIPYFIISLCYLDILRTIRNSKAGLIDQNHSPLFVLLTGEDTGDADQQQTDECQV